ncbi:hypothetical protein KP509_1Z186400 [Ceratopteris richardii]|nr:hypothetical protein KP509_1Z186400 [Ceratopteris richardii]
MLWEYVQKKQIDSDSSLPLVEFSYNSWKHKTTSLASFEVIYGFIPRSPATIGLQGKSPSASEFNLQQAAERMKAFLDRHRAPRMFQEGDHVFTCSTCNQKISDVAYKLQLPDNCKVHPIFHVSKLRPYISRDESFVDDVPFQVLDKRERKLQNRSILEYLVAWTRCPLKDATWESEALIHKTLSFLDH